jgi:hypothetical protein
VALVLGLTRVGPDDVWSAPVLSSLSAAALLLVSFVVLERRTADPLVDFSLLRNRSVSVANGFSVLSTAVIVGQSFFVSLYLREVLGYSPLRTGLALVPITLMVIAVASVIPRALPVLGVRTTLAAAGLLLAGGMVLQARMPDDGAYLTDVLPAILLTAAGLGLGFVAATIAATAGIEAHHQGLASGMLNTSQQVGGALGLAVLATVAASQTERLLAEGESPLRALNAGFSTGLAVAIGFAVAAAVIALAAPGRVPAPVDVAVAGQPVPPPLGPPPYISPSTDDLPQTAEYRASTETDQRSRR